MSLPNQFLYNTKPITLELDDPNLLLHFNKIERNNNSSSGSFFRSRSFSRRHADSSDATSSSSSSYSHSQTISLKEIFGIHELYHKHSTGSTKKQDPQLQQQEQQEQQTQEQQRQEEELIGFVIHQLHCTNEKSNKYALKTCVLIAVPPVLLPSSEESEENMSRHQVRTRSEIVSEWMQLLHQRVFQRGGSSVAVTPSETSVLPLKQQPVRRILIFINPKSGPGKAVESFMKNAKPILDRAHLQYAIIITRRALEAYEYCRDELDLSVNKEIVGVGGDGIIFEILNGVMAQVNQSRLNSEQRTRLLSQIKIGVIPAGTSNALASAIGCQLHVGQAPSVERAAFIIARGMYRPLDIVSMIQQEQDYANTPSFIRYFAFLSLTWAFIADVDLGTENLRWMGSLRNYVGVFKGFGQYKMYKGTLEWLHDERVADLESMKQMHSNFRQSLPKSSYSVESEGEDNDDDMDHIDDADLSNDSSQPNEQQEASQRMLGFAQNVTWPPCPLLSTHFAHRLSAQVISAIGTNTPQQKNVAATIGEEEVTKQEEASPSSLEQQIEQTEAQEQTTQHGEIKTLDSSFFMFLASNLPLIAHDMPLTPLSSMDDTYIDLLLLRQVWSRPKLLNVFVNNILQGTHVGIEGTEYIKTKCFMLEPERGYVAVDGEKVNTSTVFREVHPGLINVLVDK